MKGNVKYVLRYQIEHNILQQYANIFDQQDIEDSNTKQRRKLLPSCFKVKLFYLFLSNLFFYDN
jgi:hypothetical protein